MKIDLISCGKVIFIYFDELILSDPCYDNQGIKLNKE